ncbi:MAG: T9SS type A sorting domain-containing protein [Saprospiraceae bacterium]|nr:T9SS type A sorting domain-containing protein [Saprospiraceae bacterium]
MKKNIATAIAFALWLPFLGATIIIDLDAKLNFQIPDPNASISCGVEGCIFGWNNGSGHQMIIRNTSQGYNIPFEFKIEENSIKIKQLYAQGGPQSVDYGLARPGFVCGDAPGSQIPYLEIRDCSSGGEGIIGLLYFTREGDENQVLRVRLETLLPWTLFRMVALPPNQGFAAPGGNSTKWFDPNMANERQRSELADRKFTVAPNPFSNALRVHTNLMETELAECTLVNLQGQSIRMINMVNHGDELIFDTQTVPPGLYFLFIEYNESKEYHRVVKLE